MTKRKEGENEWAPKEFTANWYQPTQLKHQELIKEEGGKEGPLMRLFNPLIRKHLTSENDLSALVDQYGDFYNEYPMDTAAGRRLFKRHPAAKGLGRFIIEALGGINDEQQEFPRFEGIALNKNLLAHDRSAARGLFKNIDSTLYLNNGVDQDLLSTIAHEGTHALERYKPSVRNTLQAFLMEALKKQEKADSEEKKPENYTPTLEAGYLPKLYKGMQNIINMRREFTSLYDADGVGQGDPITRESLNKPHNLEYHFDEFGPMGVESLMGARVPWTITPETMGTGKSTDSGFNVDDSRKLLRRLMKDTHQLYINNGLLDKANPIKNSKGEIQSLPYTHNGQLVPAYNLPVERNLYSKTNEDFINKIESLRKLNSRKRVNTEGQSSGSTTTSSGNSNPLTTSITSVNSPSSLMTQPYTSNLATNTTRSPQLSSYSSSLPQTASIGSTNPQLSSYSSSLPQTASIGSTNPQLSSYSSSLPQTASIGSTNPQLSFSPQIPTTNLLQMPEDFTTTTTGTSGTTPLAQHKKGGRVTNKHLFSIFRTNPRKFGR